MPWLNGCGRSPTVSATDTLPLSFFLRWRGETYQQRQSGTMCGHSEVTCFRQLTSSTEGSPARTSVMQDLEGAWKESEAVYSSKFFDSSESAGQLSFFSKTSLQSQAVEDVLSSERLPSAGMIVGGRFFQPPMLEPRTLENDGGYWPTPRATESAENPETFVKRMGDRSDECAGSLSAQVRNQKYWPTPRAKEDNDYQQKGKHKWSTLQGAVKMWPTPRAADGEKGTRSLEGHLKERERRGNGVDLPTAVAVRRWGPPTARDWKDNGKSPSSFTRNSETLATQVGGKLSPLWTEWLMGYPIGHTELSAWAMQWFRSARKKRL